MTELVLQQLMYSVEYCIIASVHSGILCILENACVSDGCVVQNVIITWNVMVRCLCVWHCRHKLSKKQPVAVGYAHSQQYSWSLGLDCTYVC